MRFASYTYCVPRPALRRRAGVGHRHAVAARLAQVDRLLWRVWRWLRVLARTTRRVACQHGRQLASDAGHLVTERELFAHDATRLLLLAFVVVVAVVVVVVRVGVIDAASR